MSLLGSSTEVRLSYSDLERLIAVTGQTTSSAWIEIDRQSKEKKEPRRYGDLDDLVIGAYEVTGKLRELDPDPQANASGSSVVDAGGGHSWSVGNAECRSYVSSFETAFGKLREQPVESFVETWRSIPL